MTTASDKNRCAATSPDEQRSERESLQRDEVSQTIGTRHTRNVAKGGMPCISSLTRALTARGDKPAL